MAFRKTVVPLREAIASLSREENEHIKNVNLPYFRDLHVSWAYPALWTFMIVVAIALLLYFWRRRWI